MRIGYHLANSLESEKQLFEDEDLSLLPEEIWHQDCVNTSFGIPTAPLQPITPTASSPPPMTGSSRAHSDSNARLLDSASRLDVPAASAIHQVGSSRR